MVLKYITDRYPSPNESPPAISLPPFPVITTLNIALLAGEPFARLAYILFCIHSTPSLAYIVFTSEVWPSRACFRSGLWVDVDKWLARMAMQIKVKGGLTVTLLQRPEDEPVWEECLPEFRRAGGKLRIETETTVDND